ncbi:RNA-directed DNA polymerase from mobile element jockey-like [Brachionus plicatilis]|uniref:RNA-directed DNA polymerase from mobile element jockey-like n=1 Tax=Brachionus plicatilis TaxID=10195 RepID=A0A3M7R0T3_BRAPC|nr:RNA-directed DNA polymerase from mobile element jockey-like [Brachionus plicatilis]
MRKTTKPKQKWLTSDIKQLTKAKYKLWNQIRSILKSKPVPNDLKDQYKRITKETKIQVKKAVTSYEKTKIRKAKSNPKLLYDYINEQKKCKDSIRSLTSDTGEVIADKLEIANCLNAQFYKLFDYHNAKLVDLTLPTAFPLQDILERSSQIPHNYLDQFEVNDHILLVSNFYYTIKYCFRLTFSFQKILSDFQFFLPMEQHKLRTIHFAKAINS